MTAFQIVQASDYSDSIPGDAVTLVSSVCSRPYTHGQLRFNCQGPTVKVRVMAGYGLGTNPSKIAVWVDGVYSSAVQPATTTLAWYTITIPTGTHLVELQAGQQSGPGFPTIAGTWVDAVSAANLEILAPATSLLWTIIEGDSIADGEPTVPGALDWISIYRAAFAPYGRTACYSYGFRALFDESNHAAVAARLDRACPGATHVRVVNVLGTNDYGLGKQSAAAFGTMYAARTAAYRTQFGSRLQKIYAVTPFTREVEGTLPTYRSQIAALAASDLVVVDGTAMGLSILTDYNDSPALHPNDLGHAKIATACIAAFGGA